MAHSRLRTRLVGPIVLFLLTSVLAAQSQYSFDLDVPEARSSFWAVDDLKGVTKLSADLEIGELRRHSRWLPTFTVLLSAGTRGLGLTFFREQGERDVTVSVVATDAGKRTGDRRVDGWKVKGGERFRLDFDWSMGDVLLITNNGKEMVRVPLEFAPQSLRVSASTGELIGHRVSLGGN